MGWARRRGLYLVFIGIVCIMCLEGCETLRKKFTRKKKKKDASEEMVIVPRDYSAHPFPPDVMYKQYFVYWKSWNQELVRALQEKASFKKILTSIDEAIVNIEKMATYLKDEQVEALAVYIKKTKALKTEIIQAKAMPPSRLNILKYKASRILSAVNRKFDLSHMKEFLREKADSEG